MSRLALCELVLPTLTENLAFDEALLLEAEEGGPEVLRLWEWPELAVVLGAGGLLADDVDELACQEANVPILRRSSGGGTVLVGRGCLLFGLVLSFERDPRLADLHGSYRFLLQRLVDSLADRFPNVRLEGISDVVLGDRKWSGNSQQRKRRHVLHHGTILYDFDLPLVERFLKPPARQPEYRQQRAHREFVTNLPIRGEELRERLREAWPAESGAESWPLDRVQALVEAKYRQPEWIRRR